MATKVTNPKPKARRPRGAGNIQPRSGRYYATYRDIISGRRKQTGFDTWEEAEVFLAQWSADKKAYELEVKKERARLGDAAPVRRAREATHPWTLAELLTEYETRRRGHVEDSTWRDYGTRLIDLRRSMGSMVAADLTEDDFEKYKRARQQGFNMEAGDFSGRAYSPSSINKRLQMAEWVLDEAIRRGFIPGPNPLKHVERLKVPEHHMTILTEAEMAAMVAAARDVHERAMVRCLTELALRFSEAAGLPISAYNRKNKTVVIHQQIAEVRSDARDEPRQMVIKDYPKSQHGRRTLRVSEAMAKDLEAIIDSQAGVENPDGLFFYNRAGVMIRESNWLRQRWRPLLLRAGIIERSKNGKPVLDSEGNPKARKGVTPHLCRHSRASLVAASKRDLDAVFLQRFLGHHSVAFTLSKYGRHFSQNILLEPEEYMTEVLDPAAA